MNASVRNVVFFPAFFLTPVVGLAAAGAWRRAGRREAARWFAAAAIVYLLGGLVLTATINVPMNQDLADTVIPADRATAAEIWQDYSGTWQAWNAVRTVASGVALALAGLGLLATRRR
ncbi:MAG: anthrone oxygenase family protein [Actinomycetota bacterium]